MPVYQIDRRAVKEEAKGLLRTARVSPLYMAALFLAITLGLDLVDTAASRLTGGSLGVLSFSFSFVSVLVMLLCTVLAAGFTCYCLGVHRGLEMPYESLFDAFPFAGKAILLMLLQGVLVGLGLMLFVVPGIYLALAYSFALYHLCEDPGAGVVEALRRSRAETAGCKGQLLLLFLSFLPLVFLLAIPVGVGEYLLEGAFPDTLGGALLKTLSTGLLAGCVSVYLTPYMELAEIGFYRRVTESAEPSDPPGRDFGA